MRITRLSPLLLLLAAVVLSAGVAQAGSDRVEMQSPKKDCALVLGLPGFKMQTPKSLLGEGDDMTEGLVIRQSYITDGHIVIPPSGLYYTSRTLAGRMKDDKFILLGKLGYLVDYDSVFHVLHDVVVSKEKPAVYENGAKALVVQTIDPTAAGFPAPFATLAILKQSGNFYGQNFRVSAAPALKDISKNVLPHEGRYKASGIHEAVKGDTSYDEMYYGASEAMSGQSYVIVSDITPKEVKVKEFGTSDISKVYYSYAEPIIGLYKQGDKITAGKGEVSVDKVTKDTVTVTLRDTASGRKWSKTLGPLTKEMTGIMPNNERVMRKVMMLRSEDGAYQVQLNIFNAGGPVVNGQAALVVYHDMAAIVSPSIFAGDDRFLIRADT